MSKLSLVVASGGYSLFWGTGFSLRQLLLLWSTGCRHMGFSSCGIKLFCGTWNLRPGIEFMSPELAGGFLSTATPKKSHKEVFKFNEVQLVNYFFDRSCLDGSLFLWSVMSKKALPYPRWSGFSPTLPSRSFTGLYFIFRSVIDCELIFVKGMRSVSRFILWLVAVPLFQRHLLRKLSLLHCIAFVPLPSFAFQ